MVVARENLSSLCGGHAMTIAVQRGTSTMLG